MINETSGDLLKADVDAIVNTVNCVGVMGKGIALQVKRRYPDVFAAYARECKAANVRIGHMLTVPTNELHGPAWIINFPTKTHWKAPSRLSYIADGLPDLLRVVKELGIRSIAIPPLGAGNGGLDWSEVRPLKRRCIRWTSGRPRRAVHAHQRVSAHPSVDSGQDDSRPRLSPGINESLRGRPC
jgi:O-acetyl-ADP-ribose deacetylase (regulator of RNase III)